MSDNCCDVHGLKRPCDDCSAQGVIEICIHEAEVAELYKTLAKNDAELITLGKKRAKKNEQLRPERAQLREHVEGQCSVPGCEHIVRAPRHHSLCMDCR